MIKVAPGQTVDVQVKFRDEDGALFDPDSVTAYLRLPNGTITTCVYGDDCSLSKSSTGIYVFRVTTAISGDAKSGRYTVRMEGTTGDYTDVEEETIDAVESLFV